ncbi:hypothetical protein [Hymenobacter convexus]|uniref:hypothetical protein n=1 Tax=Hymenobacter sp. CA1UV-4 TaxID=3063782 RepID=UPI0027137559|nr:hypothetical protein [Hymenobacter sp. CA1UV-4]MDO7854427.1 hypothetical protein [Hymenobacter sp. CA1UV-4]
MTFTLNDFPEWKQFLEEFRQLKKEVIELRAALPEWVDQVEAERLTGLSNTTLWRERKNPHSLIQWKQDRGVRYLRSSLIAHNTSRAVVRGATPIV